MAFMRLDVCVPTQDQEESTLRPCQWLGTPPIWADSRFRLRQMGEHGGFLLPYTEMFPDCAVLHVADFVVTQNERIYVLHAQSQS